MVRPDSSEKPAIGRQTGGVKIDRWGAFRDQVSRLSFTSARGTHIRSRGRRVTATTSPVSGSSQSEWWMLQPALASCCLVLPYTTLLPPLRSWIASVSVTVGLHHRTWPVNLMTAGWRETHCERLTLNTLWSDEQQSSLGRPSSDSFREVEAVVVDCRRPHRRPAPISTSILFHGSLLSMPESRAVGLDTVICPFQDGCC